MIKARKKAIDGLEEKMEAKLKEDSEKWGTTAEAFKEWRKFEQSKLSPQSWEVVDLESFTKVWNLLSHYFGLLGKIIASNTQGLCYIMMVITAINNGGFFYMGYPIAVFAYALLLETGPKSNFWYFVILYTQILLIIQVFVSLFVF